MKGSRISFYKDQKSYRTAPDVTYRGEQTIDVVGGKAEVASDYTKKKHVFRLRLANGGDYLFQAADEDEMGQWVGAINQVAAVEQEGEAGKAHTMPAGALGEKEPKKRSFFTLKKK